MRARAAVMATLLWLAGPALHAAVGREDREAAARYYERALGELGSEDYDAAIVELKNALQRDPTSLAARVLLGKAYLDSGRPLAAEKELRLARSRGAHDSLVLLPLATAYLVQRKYELLLDEIVVPEGLPELEVAVLLLQAEANIGLNRTSAAEDRYREVLEIEPGNVGARLGLAGIGLRYGRMDEAAGLVAEAMSIDPDSAEVAYVDAELKRYRRDLEGALAGYDRALDRSPGHHPARVGRAAVLIDLGQAEAAVPELGALREEKPDDLEADYFYALALARVGRAEESRRVLDDIGPRILSLDPEAASGHGPTLLLSGFIHYQRGNFEEAYTYLIKYIDLFPLHTGARKLAGLILLRRGEPLAALDVLEPAVSLAPNDANLFGILGQAYQGARQFGRATRMFERAAELVPDSPQARTRLAMSRLLEGDLRGAKAELFDAMDLDEVPTQTGLILARMLVRQGEHDRALEVATKLAERTPDDATVLDLLGLAHVGKRDLPAARAQFERALAIDPTHAQARVHLAQLEAAEGRLDDSERMLRAVLEVTPGQVDALGALGELLATRGRALEAIEVLERLRANDPGSVPDMLRLVGLYLRSGQPARAMEVAEGLESAAPRDVSVSLALGRVAAQLGQTGRARAEYRRAGLLAGTYPPRLLTVARYQRELGDLAGARISLERILEATPTHLEATVQLARLDLLDRDFETALERAERLRQSHPRSAFGELIRGDALLGSGQPEGALQAFRAAQELSDQGEIAVRIQATMDALGQVEASLAELEGWVERNPDVLDARRALATAMAAHGRLADARRHFELLLERQPDEPSVLNNLAWVLHRMGDPGAEAFARRAHAGRPSDPDVLDTLGWILVESGDAARGLALLREAQARDASSLGTQYHVAVALARLGRVDEARRELEAIVANGMDFDGLADVKRLLAELAAR
ncbi:MAG: PEP-CTERM system TPR-repeat protein PrsT [Chromatiales bacterium]|nr:PEP-CTERM system TPR-repeat protein PrsT [Chromatiales bacterium]